MEDSKNTSRDKRNGWSDKTCGADKTKGNRARVWRTERDSIRSKKVGRRKTGKDIIEGGKIDKDCARVRRTSILVVIDI